MLRVLIAILMAITVDLTALPQITNAAYWPLYGDSHRYNVLVGGAGSGKSVFVAQRQIYRLLTRHDYKGMVVRKVADTHRDSTFAELNAAIDQFGVRPLFVCNTSPMRIFCPYTNSGLIFRGMDDPEKVKSVRGISDIWAEEATELSEPDFDQLDLRLRGRSNHFKQVTLSFNPINQNHWLRKRFWEVEPKEITTILKTTYRDNRFLDAQDIAKIERLMDQNPSLYRVYGEGEWGVLEGLIYRMPDMDAKWPTAFDQEFYGLDFGFNNPSALVKIGLRDFNPKTREGDVYLSEVLYQGGLTTQDLSNRMEAIGVARPAIIYADSAEPARIVELRRFGWNVRPAIKGPGSVGVGIDFCQSLKLHSKPSNVNLNNEFSTYCYQYDKKAGVWLEEPVKHNDHALDAMRQALYTHFRQVLSAGKVEVYT